MPSIKVKVIRPNAFMANKHGDERIPVGTIMEVEGPELPSFLVGKAEIISGGSEEQTMETGQSYEVGGESYSLEGLRELYEEVTGNKPGNKKPETLVKELTE